MPIPINKKRKPFVQLQEEIEHDNGFSDEQFFAPETTIPTKAICFASMLFMTGAFLVALGLSIKSGYLFDKVWEDRAVPLLVIGSVLFIPGAYHLYIAYNAYYRYPGYDFSMIPDLEE